MLVEDVDVSVVVVVVFVVVVGINRASKNFEAVSDRAMSNNIGRSAFGDDESVWFECTISLLLLMEKLTFVFFVVVAVLLLLFTMDNVDEVLVYDSNSCNTFLYNTTVSSIHCNKRMSTKYASL